MGCSIPLHFKKIHESANGILHPTNIPLKLDDVQSIGLSSITYMCLLHLGRLLFWPQRAEKACCLHTQMVSQLRQRRPVALSSLCICTLWRVSVSTWQFGIIRGIVELLVQMPTKSVHAQMLDIIITFSYQSSITLLVRLT